MLLALPEEVDTSSEIEVKVNIKTLKNRVERANNTAIFMASGFSHKTPVILEANPY